jgi:hypothetical protein
MTTKKPTFEEEIESAAIEHMGEECACNECILCDSRDSYKAGALKGAELAREELKAEMEKFPGIWVCEDCGYISSASMGEPKECIECQCETHYRYVPFEVLTRWKATKEQG